MFHLCLFKSGNVISTCCTLGCGKINLKILQIVKKGHKINIFCSLEGYNEK